MLNDYWLKVKIGNQDEIDINTITPDLHFVELDTTPAFSNTYQNMAGVNGSIYTTSQFDKTTINLKFLVRFKDWKDLDLAKHDIYRFFMTKEIIRIRCNIAPKKVYYCRSMPFSIAPSKVGSAGAVFTVPLDNPSGLAYSIAPSDEIVNINENDNWSYGMNIPNGKQLQYHFTNTNKFTVYNPSDIDINPYLQNDKLSISVKFTGDNITIKNTTNGSTWSYNKSGNGSDTLLINGVTSSLNGNPCSKDTNFGHIQLDKGDNNFEITGANTSDIVFSFPFVYIA